MIISVKNVMRFIGIPFAGKMWFKITVLGIAKSVICAGIGENGTAKSAINAPMVLHCLVRIVGKQIMMTIFIDGIKKILII